MLTQDDLLTPKGRIEGKSFFPDLSSADLSTRVAEWLSQGYARATVDAVVAANSDRAAAAFAYHRAFESVYLNLISNPLSSSTTEGGSASYSIEQAERFRVMAEDALNGYLLLVPVAVSASNRFETVAVKNSFGW